METQINQPKKFPKLKPKEKIFVKTLVHKNDENASKTVQEVYGIEDEGYARLKGHRLITKDNVSQAIEAERESLKSALIKKGITPDYLAEKVQVLLTGVDKEGFTDYTSVDKGLKHATNIYGVEEPSDKPRSQTTYNFIFSPEVQANVQAINEQIKAKLINVQTPKKDNQTQQEI